MSLEQHWSEPSNLWFRLNLVSFRMKVRCLEEGVNFAIIMPKGFLLNWSFKAQKAHENKVVQLLFYLSCKYDQGMKNVLFLSNFSKMLEKRAWGEYAHPYGTSKKFRLRGQRRKSRNFGVLSKGSRVCLWGVNTHPKPFLDKF